MSVASKSAEVVRYEVSEGIARITLARPEVLNAINDELARELRKTILQFDLDKSAAVAILSGEGRAFCSGADVRQRQLRPRSELAELTSPAGRGAEMERLFFDVSNWKPIVAAVHGYVIGAGLRLMLHSEVIIAAHDTKFQLAETVRGLDGSPYWALLAGRGGWDFASDVALTGRMWNSEEAHARGVVSRVAPEGEHITVAMEVANAIKQNPPLAVRAIVRARRLALEMTETEAHSRATPGLHRTEDFRESATAYVEKRRPHFVGR